MAARLTEENSFEFREISEHVQVYILCVDFTKKMLKAEQAAVALE